MTVIVGIDEPAVSRASIRLAAREASWRGVKLLAVSGQGSSAGTFGAPAARPPAGLRSAADQRRTAEILLRDAVADALGDGAAGVEVEVLPGLAGRGVVDVALRQQAELIVLAARGTKSQLAGTMSQYVLRHAPCPVLFVPEFPPG